MPFALLLAMQAAGMITDYIGTQYQQQLSDMGAKVQQAGIEANINQTRLETEDSSLQALVKLRQNLGTQLAIMGARGTAPGQGSAVLSLEDSVGNFNADERMRRINMLGQIASLKGQDTISRLNQAGGNSKLWQGFSQRTFNRFPTTSEGWDQGISKFKSSFGLTQQGGT